MSATLEHKIDFSETVSGMKSFSKTVSQCSKVAKMCSKKIDGVGGITYDVSAITSAAKEMRFRVNRFINSEAERIAEPILRDEIRDCFSGERGSKPWGDNKEKYNEWKSAHGYPLTKMVKTGRLQSAAEDALMSGSRSGDVLTLIFSWDAWGPRHDPDWDFGGMGDEIDELPF